VVKLTVQEIKDAIKQALMTEPSPSRYRLSQLGECLRRQWFEVNEPATDEKGEPDWMELGHFLKGRVFEDWLASLFPQAIRQYEVSLHGIKGHIDLFLPPDTVLEAKTTTTQSLAFVPSYDHIAQTKAYLAALRFMGVPDPKGYLIYIPADSPAQALDHIYPITLSDDEYETLCQRAKTLVEAETEPPPIPAHYSPNKLPCSGIVFNAPYRCPYFERCWGETGAIVPRSWVDGLGAQLVALDETMARFEQVVKAREEIEKKIKDVMREKGLRELVIRGDQFEIVAQMADKPREYLDIKALKEDFGDAIRRYLKETYPIFVRWRKRTG
jgi:CRISPR/Cas system-associated exonuclease Cas4 (RecB family)